MRYRSISVRNSLKFLLSVLLAVYLQEILASLILPVGVVPQLLLGWVIFLAFYWPRPQGMILAFLIGLIIDFMVAKLVGPGTVMAVIIYLFLSTVSSRLYLESLYVKIVCGYFSAFVFVGGYKFLLNVFQSEEFSFNWNLQYGFILTALLMPLVINVLKKTLKTPNSLI